MFALLALLCAAPFLCSNSLAAEVAAPFPGKKSVWNGYDRYDFPVDGKNLLVVVPKQAAPGKPWVWHGEFFGHKPAPDHGRQWMRINIPRPKAST